MTFLPDKLMQVPLESPFVVRDRQVLVSRYVARDFIALLYISWDLSEDPRTQMVELYGVHEDGWMSIVSGGSDWPNHATAVGSTDVVFSGLTCSGEVDGVLTTVVTGVAGSAVKALYAPDGSTVLLPRTSVEGFFVVPMSNGYDLHVVAAASTKIARNSDVSAGSMEKS